MVRLDQHLVATGAARSRERAREAVAAGLVTVNGRLATKPAAKVSGADEITCAGEPHPYVSRGALKLVAALDAFGVSPAGKVCLDLGASTGGFTEVLLERAAAKVYAVDVGHGQLAADIAADARVVDLERTHARDLTVAFVQDAIELVVCDVSFISLTKALPPALALCTDEANLVTLVKPQFEVGRKAIGKGGIVKLTTDELRSWLAADMLPWFGSQGWRVAGVMESPIKGSDGNTEFLVAATHG